MTERNDLMQRWINTLIAYTLNQRDKLYIEQVTARIKGHRSMIRMFRSMLDNGDIRGNLLTSRNLKGAFSEIKRLRLVRNILEEGITARGSWSL